DGWRGSTVSLVALGSCSKRSITSQLLNAHRWKMFFASSTSKVPATGVILPRQERRLLNATSPKNGAIMTNTNQTEQLQELIGDIKFAMFSTVGGDGIVRSRPMTTQNADADDSRSDRRLWFFMSASSETANDLRSSSTVNLSYAHPGKDAYVSVSGEARIVEDRAIKQRLWSKMT